jgi:hypothetical protein
MHNNEEPPEGLGSSDGGSASFHGGSPRPSLATPDQTKPNQTKPNQTKPNQLALINGEINSRIMNSPRFSGAEKFAHRV